MWTFDFIVTTVQQRVHVNFFSQFRRFSIQLAFAIMISFGLLITTKLVNQEFEVVKLNSFLRKCNGRHHQLYYRCCLTFFTDDDEYVLVMLTKISVSFCQCDIPTETINGLLVLIRATLWVQYQEKELFTH